MQENSEAKLYIVPTPIGNLEDITLRAIRILKECDLILCENTSNTQKLLKKYEIKKPTTVFYSQSGKNKINDVIEMLSDGKTLALVTDAGTPAISDPGGVLVDEVRKSLGEDAVISLPGASALTTALSASGLNTSEFIFLGFMPNKKGRETIFKEIAVSERTIIFYESVHRIMKTLEKLSQILDDKTRIAVLKELSKMHEEVARGSAKEVFEYFSKNPGKVRGEFVLIVEK